MKHIMNLALTVVLVCCGAAYAEASPDVFISPTAGFEVTKPKEWHYVSADWNLENINSIKLNDAEFHEAMKKYATAPLVAMTKFQEPHSDLNPSFKVNVKPYGPFKGKTPTELISLIVPQFKKAFKDFELVQPPIEVAVSSISSGYARFNYSLEIPEGEAFPTTSEIWIVPRGEYFFIIGAGTRQDEKNGSRKEVHSILSTVKFAR